MRCLWCRTGSNNVCCYHLSGSTAGLKVLCVLGQSSSAHSTDAPPIISSGLTFAPYLDHDWVATGDNNGR